MKIISIILLTILSFYSAKSQDFPDKIIIVQNTYSYPTLIYENENYRVYLNKSDTLVLKDKNKISKLYTELIKYDTENNLLLKFGIDTTYIQNNLNTILTSNINNMLFDWNKKQKELIFKKLTDKRVLIKEINEYLSSYFPKKKQHHSTTSGYSKSHRYQICGLGSPMYYSEFIILVYNKNKTTNIFTSKRRKKNSGYFFPYKDQFNKVIYNYKIDKLLSDYLNKEVEITEPLKGKKLLRYIVNKIIDNNQEELFKLSAYSYKDEISKLSSDFKIISAEGLFASGRYVSYAADKIKITLKNKYMLPNVYIQYIVSKNGTKLYPSDSIKKDYKKIVDRVQKIPFIKDYLKKDLSARLDIYYFNNSGINKYNIDNVNKNPKEWKNHDEYIKSLETDEYIKSLKANEEDNTEFLFDIDKSIETSERLYCGCNYRFDSDFIKKAIFIEINSKRNASSIWFLLPDNTMLLYRVDSYQINNTKILDTDIEKFGKNIQLPTACLRFDKNGNVIKKK